MALLRKRGAPDSGPPSIPTPLSPDHHLPPVGASLQSVIPGLSSSTTVDPTFSVHNKPPHHYEECGCSSSRHMSHCDSCHCHSSSPSTSCNNPMLVVKCIMCAQQQWFKKLLDRAITSAPPAAKSSLSSVDHTSKLCMSNPNNFSGNIKTMETFINSCVNIFMAQPLVYLSVETQVHYALSFVKGNVIHWCDALFAEIVTKSYQFDTWSCFTD